MKPGKVLNNLFPYSQVIDELQFFNIENTKVINKQKCYQVHCSKKVKVFSTKVLIKFTFKYRVLE